MAWRKPPCGITLTWRLSTSSSIFALGITPPLLCKCRPPTFTVQQSASLRSARRYSFSEYLFSHGFAVARAPRLLRFPKIKKRSSFPAPLMHFTKTAYGHWQAAFCFRRCTVPKASAQSFLRALFRLCQVRFFRRQALWYAFPSLAPHLCHALSSLL